MRGIFKCWTERIRDSEDEWLLVDQHGEYQYRNPESLFVHDWALFKTKEAAMEHIDERIPRADRKHMRLYRRERFEP
jgi:hypothetical protein